MSRDRILALTAAAPACPLCTADRYVRKNPALASPHLLIVTGIAFGWMNRGLAVVAARDVNVDPEVMLAYFCPAHRKKFNDLAHAAAAMVTGNVDDASELG